MSEQQYPESGIWMQHSNSGKTYESMGRGKMKFNGVWYDAVFYQNAGGELYARTVDDFDKHFSEFGK